MTEKISTPTTSEPPATPTSETAAMPAARAAEPANPFGGFAIDFGGDLGASDPSWQRDGLDRTGNGSA